jgi:hypothetical protein
MLLQREHFMSGATTLAAPALRGNKKAETSLSPLSLVEKVISFS